MPSSTVSTFDDPDAYHGAFPGADVEDCGFTQLGRFSGAYRMLFGEMPLATLRRLPLPGLTPIFADSA